MLDMTPAVTLVAKESLRALRLNRETLRELDAGELVQAQAARRTYGCVITDFCTRGCGPITKKC